MNRIQAEVTIQLARQIEATEETPAITRYYRFSMPVGASFEESIAYAKEMVVQVELMQQKAKDLEDKKAKEEEDNNKLLHQKDKIEK